MRRPWLGRYRIPLRPSAVRGAGAANQPVILAHQTAFGNRRRATRLKSRRDFEICGLPCEAVVKPALDGYT